MERAAAKGRMGATTAQQRHTFFNYKYIGLVEHLKREDRRTICGLWDLSSILSRDYLFSNRTSKLICAF